MTTPISGESEQQGANAMYEGQNLGIRAFWFIFHDCFCYHHHTHMKELYVTYGPLWYTQVASSGFWIGLFFANQRSFLRKSEVSFTHIYRRPSCEWVSHVIEWVSHVIDDCVIAHLWMRHEGDSAHEWMSHEWAMSQIRIRESCHIRLCHVAHTNESRHSHDWSRSHMWACGIDYYRTWMSEHIFFDRYI